VVKLGGLEPARVIEPSVQGTIGILESARRFGPSVKRVVVTSSISAIMENLPGPKVFTEADWNNQSVGIVERDGNAAEGTQVYFASKVLAERAAWEYVKKHNTHFDLTVILPGLLVGPLLNPLKDFAAVFSGSNGFLYKGVTDASAEFHFEPSVIDVRDCGLAHVLALEVPEAAGERFITVAGVKFWQEIRDELRAAGVPGIAEGTPGSYVGKTAQYGFDGTKAERVLGFKYRPILESVQAGIEAVRARFPNETGSA